MPSRSLPNKQEKCNRRIVLASKKQMSKRGLSENQMINLIIIQ
jgi:hypothetical protein